jgi:hypothetical protein
MFSLFLEPYLRWLTVGSRGYRPGAPTTKADPKEPTTTYFGHGFADDLSLATDSPTNMSIQLKKLSLFNAYTGITVHVNKFCITGTLWSKGNALSLANRSLFASCPQNHFVTTNTYSIPITPLVRPPPAQLHSPISSPASS